MSRLPRPLIPLAVKLDVALRQIGDDATLRRVKIMIARHDRKLRKELDVALFLLACTRGYPVKDFQLDHDPALENREKLVEFPDGRRQRRVIVVPKGAKVIRYYPDANDPDHLFYRPHSAEIAGSHKIKTNVRGDRGQLSDNALARKNKRAAKKKTRPKTRWPSRPFPKGRGFSRRVKRS